MRDNLVNLSISVPTEFRQELRVYLAERNITLHDYLMALIDADMKQNKKQG